jgi:dephospho-CoA kinase
MIIGITGTIGAGKGTIVDYLAEQFQFTHFSVRQFLMEEATKRNLPLNRDTYVALANELRAQNSPSYITDQLYIEAIQKGGNAVIESIRTPGEIDSLCKNDHFFLLAVDADPHLRYERVVLRNSETDQISFETFLENEKREMTASDPNKQNLSECIRRADFVIRNDHDIPTLFQNLDSIINDHLTQ